MTGARLPVCAGHDNAACGAGWRVIRSTRSATHPPASLKTDAPRRLPEVDTATDADPDAERNAREAASPDRGPDTTHTALALRRGCAPSGCRFGLVLKLRSALP